jgi:hypothetical protein
MAELFLHKRPVHSVFNLLGENENDITSSVGWAFSRSAGFLRAFLHKTVGELKEYNADDFVVSLQEYQSDSGITDIEIRGSDIHIIIEAKRGFWLPSEKQMRQYIPRFSNSAAKTKMFVTMAECSKDYASQHLPIQIDGIPIYHLSWKEIGFLSRFVGGTQSEKRLMEELRNYLATIVSMQKQDSNWVYVVSLGGMFAEGLSFIDVVVKRKRYFHPIGINGWPKDPPNYLGFRYWGELQSIHHVEKVQLIENFHPFFPERADQKEPNAFYLYDLGEPISPSKSVPTGNIYASGRKWAMIDLLLTSKTIAAASDASALREQEI